MNTMTLFPSQYVEETPVARSVAGQLTARRPDAGLSQRAAPVRRVLAGVVIYALMHVGLVALGIGTEVAMGIGILGLAILILALSIEHFGPAVSLLAAANLAVTVALVHPELAGMPLLAAVLQLVMVLALIISEAIVRNSSAITLRAADLRVLEGAV